jgi:hypothetical protein
MTEQKVTYHWTDQDGNERVTSSTDTWGLGVMKHLAKGTVRVVHDEGPKVDLDAIKPDMSISALIDLLKLMSGYTLIDEEKVQVAQKLEAIGLEIGHFDDHRFTEFGVRPSDGTKDAWKEWL